MTKYTYQLVVQTNYGQGWEDTTFEDNRKDARQMVKDYRLNQPEYSHRIITRRILNA